MKKNLIILLLIAVVTSTMIFNIKSKAASEFQETGIHKALASSKDWLNTQQPITSEELKGRIILLDFWTFCCINCMHVIPDLHYLEKKFGDKLTVIGVHSAKFINERDSENIRNAILRYDIEHPVINDADFSIWNKFGVRAWPTFILINPLGQIQEVYSGEGNREAVEEEIKDLLDQYPNINTAPLPLDLEKNKAPKSILSFPGKIDYTEDMGGEPALFISDSGHNRIVVSRLSGEIVATVGTGEAGLKDANNFSDAQFNAPQGIKFVDGSQVDKDHVLGILYVADTENHAIRAIDFDRQTVTTVAGTGVQGYVRNANNSPALKTQLASPWDLEFFPDNQHLVIAMAGTHQLWQYDTINKTVSVIAGNGRESIDDGELPYNSLSQPSGLSAFYNQLYFVDSETSSLRVLENGEITTLIGTGLFDFGFADGDRSQAKMQHSIGVTATDQGILIADSYNHAIRKYDPASKKLSTIFGDGKRGSLNEPNDIIKIGNEKYYITDTNNNQIKIFNTTTGKLDTLELYMPQNEKPISDLPNATQDEFKIGESVKLSLQLPDTGWKFNDLAPTWLAVFDDKDKLIKKYGKDDLKKPIELDELSSSGYRVQGTFYYCESKEGSVCLVQSFDGKLTKTNSDTVQEIKVQLKK